MKMMLNFHGAGVFIIPPLFPAGNHRLDIGGESMACDGRAGIYDGGYFWLL